MYDTETVQAISGKVIKVDKATPMKGMSYGVHVALKTEKEIISVHSFCSPVDFVKDTSYIDYGHMLIILFGEFVRCLDH